MNNRGFTLIELVLTTTIMSVVAFLFIGIISVGMDTYYFTSDSKDAAQEARVAITRMVRELKSLKGPGSITAATNNQIMFNKINGEIGVSFSLSGTDLLRNGQVLADGVSSFNLSYYDQDGDPTTTVAEIWRVTIDIETSEANETIHLRTGVFVRNI